jgi:hypothetical protein
MKLIFYELINVTESVLKLTSGRIYVTLSLKKPKLMLIFDGGYLK